MDTFTLHADYIATIFSILVLYEIKEVKVFLLLLPVLDIICLIIYFFSLYYTFIFLFLCGISPDRDSSQRCIWNPVRILRWSFWEYSLWFTAVDCFRENLYFRGLTVF